MLCARSTAATPGPEAAKPATTTASAATQPATAPAALPAKSATPLVFRENSSGAAWQMVSSVLVVLMLGVACWVLLKKVMPKMRPGAARNITVVETAFLGPGKSVHIVKVGREKYLLGATKEGLSMLARVTDALDGDFHDALKAAAAKVDAQPEAKP